MKHLLVLTVIAIAISSAQLAFADDPLVAQCCKKTSCNSNQTCQADPDFLKYPTAKACKCG